MEEIQQKLSAKIAELCGVEAASVTAETNLEQDLGMKSATLVVLIAYLEDGRTLPPPDTEEKKRMILRHAALQLETKGEYIGVREMRKHLSWYTAGMPGSARLRQRINSAERFEEIAELVESM